MQGGINLTDLEVCVSYGGLYTTHNRDITLWATLHSFLLDHLCCCSLMEQPHTHTQRRCRCMPSVIECVLASNCCSSLYSFLLVFHRPLFSSQGLADACVRLCWGPQTLHPACRRVISGPTGWPEQQWERKGAWICSGNTLKTNSVPKAYTRCQPLPLQFPLLYCTCACVGVLCDACVSCCARREYMKEDVQ